MEIRYKLSKEHLNADALLQIQTNNLLYNSKSIALIIYYSLSIFSLYESRYYLYKLITLYISLTFPLNVAYKADLIQINDDFRKRLVKALPLNLAIKKIYKDITNRTSKAIKNNEVPLTTKELFRVNLDLSLIY